MRGSPRLPRCSQQLQTFFATDGWPGGSAIALRWAAGRPSEGEERPLRNWGRSEVHGAAAGNGRATATEMSPIPDHVRCSLEAGCFVSRSDCLGSDVQSPCLRSKGPHGGGRHSDVLQGEMRGGIAPTHAAHRELSCQDIDGVTCLCQIGSANPSFGRGAVPLFAQPFTCFLLPTNLKRLST